MRGCRSQRQENQHLKLASLPLCPQIETVRMLSQYLTILEDLSQSSVVAGVDEVELRHAPTSGSSTARGHVRHRLDAKSTKADADILLVICCSDLPFKTENKLSPRPVIDHHVLARDVTKQQALHRRRFATGILNRKPLSSKPWLNATNAWRARLQGEILASSWSSLEHLELQAKLDL